MIFIKKVQWLKSKSKISVWLAPEILNEIVQKKNACECGRLRMYLFILQKSVYEFSLNKAFVIVCTKGKSRISIQVLDN